MITRRVLVALALALACDACKSTASSTPIPAAPSTSAAPKQAASAAVATLDSVELETGGATREEPLPLVIAMHGLGDRPEAFAGVYSGFSSKAHVEVLRAPDAWGDGFSWFPFRASDGDALRAKGISGAAERVAANIERLQKTRASRGKVIVTGFSQGAMISFALAARYSNLVRAAIPIGGTLPEPLWPALDAGDPGVRIVALHGEADELVPLGPTRRGVDALKRAGFDVRIETFPGVGHRIPSEMRARYFEILSEEIARD